MNRLIRIALTLFVSATVMVFLIRQRIDRLPQLSPGDRFANDQQLDALHNEVIMINVGMGMAAVMLIAGLALIVTAIVRSRKKNHG